MNQNNAEEDYLDIDFISFDDVMAEKNSPKKEEGLGVSAIRNITRTGARVGETIAGLPGDIRDLGESAGMWIGDKARKLLGKDPLSVDQKNYVRDQLKESDWNFLGKITESLPTSNDLKEGYSRKYLNDWNEPQNELEKFSDEVAQDFAALALPVKGKIPFARSLGTSIVANTGGEVAKAFGGDTAKDYTKLGLLFTSGLIGQNKGGVKRYISGLYDEMKSEIPTGAEVSSKNLTSKLNKIESILKKGDPTDASKQVVFDKIKSIKNKTKSGFIPVDEVLELNKSVNESIFSKGSLVRNENKLFDVREALHETAREYGEQNPTFLSQWKEANQAYASTETSRKLGDWVKRNVKPRDYVHALAALGIEGGLLGAPTALKTLGAAGAAAGTAYSAEVLKRISQSPALRRYYTNTITSGLKQNKVSFIRNLNQLEKGLKKDFDDLPYEIIDFDL